MIKIKESTAMTDTAPALSKAEAKKLTQKIKTAVDDLWSLLVQAHEGRAWKALGYQTWEAYVYAEFSMSRRRSYQLIDKGNVIQAIAEATGENVQHVAQISARDAAAVKDDLPDVTDEIKAKVDAGEDPQKATEETIAYHRAAKAKLKAEKEAKRKKREAQQAENDRQRQANADALPQHVKDREAAKAEAIAARKAKPVDVDALTAEAEELREANDALEAEVAALKADNAKWEAMRVQFEQGGFEAVIAGKDEQIRVLKGQVERESQEKVKNLRDRDRYLKILNEKYNHFKDMTIDIETGEVGYV